MGIFQEAEDPRLREKAAEQLFSQGKIKVSWVSYRILGKVVVS